MGHFLMPLIFLSLSAIGTANAGVQLIPFRIEESRSAAFVKDDVGRNPDGVTLIFTLKGPEVESAARYGDLILDEAVDDRGTNLIPKDDPFNKASQFQEFSNDFFRKSDIAEKRPVPSPQIQIHLGLPKRSATKIAHLRGSVSLAATGTITTIELGGIKQLNKKKLDISPKAGLGITVTAQTDDNKEVHAIGIEMTGDANAMESIEVVDASGKTVSTGMSSWSFNGGPPHKSLDLGQAADDSMKLVVKIAVDRKITRTPFDLKDIVLP